MVFFVILQAVDIVDVAQEAIAVVTPTNPIVQPAMRNGVVRQPISNTIPTIVHVVPLHANPVSIVRVLARCVVAVQTPIPIRRSVAPASCRPLAHSQTLLANARNSGRAL